MSRTTRRLVGAIGAGLLSAGLAGCGGGPPVVTTGGSQLVSVPQTDGLLSPDGPLTAEQVYALDPSAVAQAFRLSPDPMAAAELAKLQDENAQQVPAQGAHANPAVPQREYASSSQTYTYLYCYATGWLQQGSTRLPLGVGGGDDFYLSGWAMQPGANGSSQYVKVPVRVPSASALSPVNWHLVYYTTQSTPAQLDSLCESSLLADATTLREQEYPGASGTLEVQDVIARGRNNSLSSDHPFLPLAGSVGDGHIHTLVSLGDSLSDTDASSNMLFHIVPNRETWLAGHFSNGWVWSEYAANDLGVTPYNEAWAAAGASSQSVLRTLPGANWLASAGVGFYFPSIVQQAGLYDKRVVELYPRDPNETLYTLLIGGNDFVNYDEPVATVLSQVQSALQQLITVDGAKNIVVMNLPDVTAAPVFLVAKAAIKPTVQASLDAYDAQLPALVAQVDSQYPQARVTLFDTRGVFDTVLHDPQAYGFVNASQSCLRDPSGTYSQTESMRAGCNGYNYVFWDNLHPTTAVDQIIGQSFAAFARQHYAF